MEQCFIVVIMCACALCISHCLLFIASAERTYAAYIESRWCIVVCIALFSVFISHSLKFVSSSVAGLIFRTKSPATSDVLKILYVYKNTLSEYGPMEFVSNSIRYIINANYRHRTQSNTRKKRCVPIIYLLTVTQLLKPYSAHSANFAYRH